MNPGIAENGTEPRTERIHCQKAPGRPRPDRKAKMATWKPSSHLPPADPTGAACIVSCLTARIDCPAVEATCTFAC